jgi:hypothetical protein
VAERLAFVAMFTLMATFVVGLTVLTVKSGAHVLANGSLDGSQTMPAVQGTLPDSGNPAAGAPAGTVSARRSEVLNARLSAALRAALGPKAAHLSVGVVDTVTGAEAVFHASMRYHAGGIARADILAALLYQHQQARAPISGTDADLAAEMIENGSSAVTIRLWRAIGRGPGLAAANRALGLSHTVPGAADNWGLTRTTTADQLRLLADLTTARSVLHSGGRDFELGLIAGVGTTRRLGAPAASSPGTSYAVTDGWQPDPQRFVVNSVGVIDHAGHELLIVVLSRGWPTQAAGISEVRAAAAAAASAIA